jgi:hypothetical protein
MTMVDPDGRDLVGAQFVASGTANAWTSNVPLSADAAPGAAEHPHDLDVNGERARGFDDLGLGRRKHQEPGNR